MRAALRSNAMSTSYLKILKDASVMVTSAIENACLGSDLFFNLTSLCICAWYIETLRAKASRTTTAHINTLLQHSTMKRGPYTATLPLILIPYTGYGLKPWGCSSASSLAAAAARPRPVVSVFLPISILVLFVFLVILVVLVVFVVPVLVVSVPSVPLSSLAPITSLSFFASLFPLLLPSLSGSGLFCLSISQRKRPSYPEAPLRISQAENAKLSSELLLGIHWLHGLHLLGTCWGVSLWRLAIWILQVRMQGHALNSDWAIHCLQEPPALHVVDSSVFWPHTFVAIIHHAIYFLWWSKSDMGHLIQWQWPTGGVGILDFFHVEAVQHEGTRWWCLTSVWWLPRRQQVLEVFLLFTRRSLPARALQNCVSSTYSCT